MMMHGLTNFKS